MLNDAGDSAPWPSVTVAQADWKERLLVQSPSLLSRDLRLLDNTIVFFAKGDAGGCRLTVRLKESDGSVWEKVVGLEEEWKPYVFHQSQFRYVSGGVGRGRKKDHCYLFRTREAEIGYDMYTGPVIPAAQSFSISTLRVVEDEVSVAELMEVPRLPLVASERFTYTFHGEDVVSLLSGRTFSTGKTRMGSPQGLPQGLGGEHGLDERWIPVFRAVDRQGKTLGYPASLYVEAREGHAARRAGWVGLQPDAENMETFSEMLNECVGRLQKGFFLYRGGTEKRVFRQRETLRLSARVAAVQPEVGSLRITAQLQDEGGEELRFVESVKFTVPPGRSTSLAVPLNLGMVPVVTNESQTLVLRILLHDSEDRKVEFDELRQLVKVKPEKAGQHSREFLRMQGSKFYWSNVAVQLLGVRYSLPYYPGGRTVHYEGMNRDLSQLSEAGFNTLWIECQNWAEADAYHYLIDEASRLGLWLVVALPDLHPAHQNLAEAKKWLAFLNLPTNNRVAALVASLKGEQITKLPRHLPTIFTDWLEGQYGRLPKASKTLNLSGKPRTWLEKLASGSLAREVGDRFLGDTFSRALGKAKRMLQASGSTHLLGVEPSWISKPGNVRFVGGWNPVFAYLHADFICGQPSVLVETQQELMAASFMTRYTGSLLEKRPFVWMGLDPVHPLKNKPYNESYHAWLIDQQINLVKTTGAAGFFFTSLADEGTDLKLFNPDGQRRVAGERILKQSRNLKKNAPAPRRVKKWSVTRAGLRYDVPALLRAWKEENANQSSYTTYTGIQWEGATFSTDTMPLFSLAERKVEGMAPLAYANAEWGLVEVNDQPVLWPEPPVHRVQVGDVINAQLWNSGLATWLASERNRRGSVWVQVEAERSSGKSFIRTDGVQSGSSSIVTLEVQHSGRLVLRPLIWPDRLFGEALIIDVE